MPPSTWSTATSREGRGGKIAFIDPARRLTYGELADSVRARRPDARHGSACGAKTASR